MDSKELILQRSNEAKEIFLPNLSADPVIFGFDQNELKVLLLKMNYRKQWFLPGGYVKKDEDLDDAVIRILKERAGVNAVSYLEERTEVRLILKILMKVCSTNRDLLRLGITLYIILQKLI